uniref:CX9C domain-containing protein n=1 Tax=Steinernema glaseri TaxID=37863 RepID=A0A1I7ZQ99_9BILA
MSSANIATVNDAVAIKAVKPISGADKGCRQQCYADLMRRSGTAPEVSRAVCLADGLGALERICRFPADIMMCMSEGVNWSLKCQMLAASQNTR